MAKKIIILSKVQEQESFHIDYLYWLDVPLAQQPFRANPNATSAYPEATVSEVDAIKSGAILEVAKSAFFINGVSNSFVANSLSNTYNTAQTMLNNDKTYQYFGSYWDGTSWTIQGA